MNKLIKLTYQHHFYIGYLPGLSEALLDQTEEFFSLLRLNTSPKNFETSLVDGNFKDGISFISFNRSQLDTS